MNWLIIVGLMVVVGILYSVYQPKQETKEGFMSNEEIGFTVVIVAVVLGVGGFLFSRGSGNNSNN